MTNVSRDLAQRSTRVADVPAAEAKCRNPSRSLNDYGEALLSSVEESK